MLEKLLAQVFCGIVGRESKLDIIHPHMNVDVTIAMHNQFQGVKALEEEISWLQKDLSERIKQSKPKFYAAMTQRNADLVARLAAELPKKGEDQNWSEELRVAVWKRRQRDEVRANIAQARRIEELQQQVLDLTDQLEAARFDAATADADTSGDTEVLVQEDPAARAEALTGVAQALANIAEVRAADDGVSTVPPEAPAASEVVELAAAAAWQSSHSHQPKAHFMWAFLLSFYGSRRTTFSHRDEWYSSSIRIVWMIYSPERGGLFTVHGRYSFPCWWGYSLDSGRALV